MSPEKKRSHIIAIQPIDKFDVTIEIKGPELDRAFPLLEVTTIFQEFHYFIDKAYLSTTGTARMTRTERLKYAILAKEFRRGSLFADLQIGFFTGSLLPGVVGLSPWNLWEVAKNSYEYLKMLMSLRSEGKEPKINIEGDNYAPVLNIENSTIIVNKPVHETADRAEPHIKKLTSSIKPGNIDSIALQDKSGEGFVLTEKEKKLFNPHTRIDKEPVSLRCNIYRYDKEANTGKLRVFEGQTVPGGDYKFKPIGSSQPIHYILAMAKPKVTVNALKEIEIHTSGVERLAALHIISIDEDDLTLF
ncbi:MAG: hypothetical protein ACFFG0_37150 [Candidatus Thorarchaeota archaeon]